MAQHIFNVGNFPNDGTGEKLRNAFQNVNANFSDLYGIKANLINGKLSVLELPPYVRDYLTQSEFPLVGEAGYIYLDRFTSKFFYWSGSTYALISGAVDSVNGKTGVVVINKSDVGLLNVDNTSDINKPISTVQQIALNLKAPVASPTFTGVVNAPSIIGSLTGNASSATKLNTPRTINGIAFDGTANITINAVDSTSRIPTSEKGVANGVASLDANGIILTSQLPSYVDDVLEFSNLSSFPTVGESGKIYIALDSNKCYRWSGSTYVYITSGAVDSVNGKTGVVNINKSDVGLGNVDNTSDLNKPISNATQAALDNKVPTNRTVNGQSLSANVTLSKGDVGLGNADNTADSVKNVQSAAKLTTARTINSVAFDGTSNITINATDSIPRLALTGGTLTGGLIGTTGTFTGVLTAPTAPAGTNTTQVATTAYVQANSIGGTGAAGQVAFWNGTGTQTSTSRFLYDSSNNILTMNAVNGFFDVNRTINGTQAAPNFENILRYGASGFYSYIQGGNSFTSNQGTYLKFVVNSSTGTLQDALTIGNNSTSTFAVGSANTFSPTTQADGSLLIGNAASGTFAPLIVGKSSNGVGMYLAGLVNDTNTSPDIAFNVRTTSNTDFSALAMTSTAYRFSRFGTVLLDILRNGNTLIGTTTSQTWINSDSSFGTSKLNLSAVGSARVIEINREDTTVTSGITGGSGLCLSTVPFANGVGGVFGNNVLGYMRNPLESVGIRGACVPLSDTGTEPIVKIEANSSTTNGFSGIKFVDTRPILGVYNYSSSLFRVMATGAVGMGAGLQSPNYNLHVHANANSNFLQMTSLNSGTATSDGLILGIDTNSAVLFINRENTHIAFHTNNSEKLRVHASGGVSIGNTSDLGAGTLNVTGAVTAPTFNGALNGNASSASMLNGYSSQLALITSMDFAFARNGNNVIAPVGSATFKTWLAISNVDNTSDLNKPISTATQTALNSRALLGGSNTFTGINNFSGGVVVVADPVNAYHAVPKNYVDSNFQPKLTYKVYTATLNQTGTVAPIPTVMDNSIGSIVWTRTGVGTYSGTLSGAFTTGKTTVFLNPAFGTGNVNAAQWVTSSRIDIKTLNGLSPTDGILTTDIEIRVYY